MNEIHAYMKKMLRRGSIFQKTFLGLFLVSIIMIGFFLFGQNYAAGQNQRERAAMSELSRLRQSAESYHSNFAVLEQGMNQLLWSSDATAWLVTLFAGDENTSRNRSFRLALTLKETVKNTILIDRAVLYAPYTDLVMTSDGSCCASKESEDWPLIRQYLDTNPETNDWVGRNAPAVTMNYDGELYAVCTMNISSRVGILLYRIDRMELIRLIGIRGENGTAAIYVYDRDHKPLFGDLVSYPRNEPDWDENSEFVIYGDKQAQRSRCSGWYRFDTMKNGWSYVMPLDTKQLSFSVADALRLWIPAAILFLILSLIFAWYISNAVYAPVNRLMNLVRQGGNSGGQDSEGLFRGRTEIDYLEGAYESALGEREQLQGLMSMIAPELLSSLLNGLMSGKQLTEQRVAEILHGIGDPLSIHGRYAVMTAMITETEEDPIEDKEINLFLLSMNNFAETNSEGICVLRGVRTGRLLYSFVMCFASGVSVVDIKNEYHRLSGQLLRMTDRLPHAVHVERGNICQNIMDIRQAFRESEDKLKYSVYFRCEDPEEDPLSQKSEMHLISQEYTLLQTGIINDRASEGDVAAAADMVRSLLGNIASEYTDVAKYRRMVQILLDGLTEKVISLPLNETDLHRVEKSHIAREIAGMDTREKIDAEVMNYCSVAVNLIASYSGQNRYRYVEKAKEYIAEHYADRALSLTDIATGVGISASYLSELFTEIAGEKFSSYLASFRVEKAARLLRTTVVTAREIGFMCGFNSIQNFNRVFKKYTGTTPGQYRTEHSMKQ